MSRTVYLHVGIAKTGTTYLQRRLYSNRDALARHGTLYPGDLPGAHFFAALDVRGARFKGHAYPQAAGAWARLVREVDAFAGTALVSHETLARSAPTQIDTIVGSFDTDDVRILITARDLARQLPAVWQEQLKNRGTTAFDAYLAGVFGGWPPADRQRGFWSTQDVASLADRWGAAVGPDHVTVVTVPPSGADRGELWRRFAAAADLPAIEYEEMDDSGNASLGVAEAELLRRLNPLLEDRLDWPAYDARIKKHLGEQVMAPLRSLGPLNLPADRRGEAVEISRTMVDRLAAIGACVVGDLADLIPPEGDDAPSRRPDELTDAELLDAALAALAALAAEPGRRGRVPAVSGRYPARWPVGRLDQVVSRLRNSLRRGHR